MAEKILKFGGTDPLSRVEADRGEAEPERDPRGQRGTEIVRGVHLMSAVEQLEPATTASMTYFDPDAPDVSLEELTEAVREGRMDLGEVMTKTSRFTPLVNPRRSRQKESGELTPDSDADLWHVPTSSYQAMPPRQIFRPLAEAIDANEAIDNSGVFGEFRTRRNGGEVHGDIWFDDLDVGAIDGDPVRLGFKFRWDYYGDTSFGYRPFAQRTRCKNSVAPLDDWQTVMHHNKSINWREMWGEAVRELGIYGDRVSQQIQAARDIILDFETTGDLTEGEDNEDGVVPVPFGLEEFYEHIGFGGDRIPADHAREEARNSGNPEESATRISAWNVHNGATYWLSWHWNGAEDSRAFRQYRRTANDLLFNPHQIVERAQEDFERQQRRRVVQNVLEGRPIEEATDEEMDEINNRMMNNDAVVRMRSSVETIGEMVEQFEQTEERLDRMQEAAAEQ